MDTLNDIRPNTLAITLRVSELEAIINRCITKALASPPEQTDPDKQNLITILAELSPEQTRQVLVFASELLANMSPQESHNPGPEEPPTLVDAREADSEAQATIAHALSSLINGDPATSRQ